MPTASPRTAPLRRTLRSSAAAALLAAVALGTSACGGGADDQAGAPASDTQPSGTASVDANPNAGTGSPESSELNATRDQSKAQGNFSAPAGADEPGVPIVSAGKGLEVDRPGGPSTADVRVKGYAGGDDDFCVHIAAPGPNDPDPTCNTGTLLALQFFSDQAAGHAIGAVDFVPLERRDPPTELVVSGVATGDVKAVSVTYAQHEYEATLSTRAVRLPVDKSMARVLAGSTKAETRRLPTSVVVRLFAVAFPRDAGNPPDSAVPTTLRPVDGKMTLALS